VFDKNFTEYLVSREKGAAYPAVLPEDIADAVINLPPLPEQRAIAAMLGALDDKIELNRRMNRTLEAIAQAVFRHWFVENEEAEGWEVGKFSDISFIARDVINPAQFPSEVFNHYSIPAYDEKRFPISELGSQIKSSKFVVLNNCVLISKLNPEIPRIWLPFSLKGRSICSTEFLVNVPTGYFSPEYLYGLFHSQPFQDRFISMVTGTSGSHQRVKAEYLLDMDIELPPENLVKRYTETVKPLFQKVQQNILKSRTLAALRDALLPKLMRGEVRVKDTAQFLEER
jgi:type I restriction enzyme S subunit